VVPTETELFGTRIEGYIDDKVELAWPSFGAEYIVIKCCVLDSNEDDDVDSGGGRGGGGGGGGAFFLPSLPSWTKPGKWTNQFSMIHFILIFTAVKYVLCSHIQQMLKQDFYYMLHVVVNVMCSNDLRGYKNAINVREKKNLVCSNFPVI